MNWPWKRKPRVSACLSGAAPAPRSQPAKVFKSVLSIEEFRFPLQNWLHHTRLADQGARFVSKVKDISEFLVELGPVRPSHPLKLKATYHDACHLCHGQQIRRPPRQLLEMIPELELVPLDESEICCGAAGSYNLTQPEMADRLGRRKAEHILATGADAVFTANVGCLIQIGRHLRQHKPGIWIAHPVDALWESYRGHKR